MLIEDKREIRQTIDSILSDQGYEVVHVSHAREALDRLRREPGLRPCIILVDPFANGVSVASLAEVLREDDQMAIVPVRLSGTRESGSPPSVNIADRSLVSPEILLDVVRDHCPPDGDPEPLSRSRTA